MIAMQYSIVLPADYDMAIIRRRIASKGHLLDGFPDLAFKAYLYAERSNDALASRDNLYAPLYLWQRPAGMQDFLCGSGFAGLVQAFGRPSVRCWSVWQASLSASLAQAGWASREVLPIAPHVALDALRADEREQARHAVDHEGALAALSAFDPDGWNLLRFRLWREPRPELAGESRQLYAVGHMSLPAG